MIDWLNRLLSRENSILLLTLTALACLPLAVGRIVRDAASSLLLPVTLLSALICFGLAATRIRKFWAGFIFILCGPLLLFIRVGNLGEAITTFFGHCLELGFHILQVSFVYSGSQLSLTPWLAAGNELIRQLAAFCVRLAAWVSAIWQHAYVGDPAARAFAWSLGLWWTAAWASWQVRRNSNALAGLFPVTILLGLIIYYTAQKTTLLWVNLPALILLLGITNFHGLIIYWKSRLTDYSDSVWEDTLVATVALGLVLVTSAFLVSSFSIKDMMDRLRERQQATAHSASATASANGSGRVVSGVPPANTSLQAAHIITGGPTLSNDVVMLISTGDLPPMPTSVDLDAPRYYWRTLTYQNYTGSGWSNPPSVENDVTPHQMLIPAKPDNYRVVKQVVTFPNGIPGNLYWTGALVQSDASMQVAWRTPPVDNPSFTGSDPLQGADLIGGLTTAQSYTAESLLPNAGEADLEASPAIYPDWIARTYLQLPDKVPERVRALARDLTANEATPYDRAIAIETYLRKYPYTLDVPAPPPDQDAADYFLFNLKKGYCDYYATAMTVLARAAGLPARLVVGYTSGSYDAYTAEYVITQSDAHAWTEVYFTGIGWIEFEPTASLPAPFRSRGSMQIQTPVPVQPKKNIWDQLPVIPLGRLNIPWQPFIGLVALYVLWLATESLRISFLSPSEATRRLYQRLRRLVRPILENPPPGETAHEFARTLSTRLAGLQGHDPFRSWVLSPVPAQLTALTDLYAQSLFSRRQLTRRDSHRVIRLWFGMRWRLFLVRLLTRGPQRSPHPVNAPSTARDSSAQ